MLIIVALVIGLFPPTAFSHESSDHHRTPKSNASAGVQPLPFQAEEVGPSEKWEIATVPPDTKVSGQGFWKFSHQTLPLPQKIKTKLAGAHGTILVDQENDHVYWGLQDVGWIRFSKGLSEASIVAGDPAFAKGNLHGADILYRKGSRPLIAAADNVEGELYLFDSSFQKAKKLKLPKVEPYSDGMGFSPTDVAFTSPGELWATDGYGRGYLFPIRQSDFFYKAGYFGGRSFSQTPHGISFDKKDSSILVAARPEAQLKRFLPKETDSKSHNLVAAEILGFPPGSTVCDVDLWDDYAVVPALDGPMGSAGPIYIVNLKQKKVVSILRIRDELGIDDALHIHDAAWYFKKGPKGTEVYILYTNWNPGGIGALKLSRTGS